MVDSQEHTWELAKIRGPNVDRKTDGFCCKDTHEKDHQFTETVRSLKAATQASEIPA